MNHGLVIWHDCDPGLQTITGAVPTAVIVEVQTTTELQTVAVFVANNVFVDVTVDVAVDVVNDVGTSDDEKIDNLFGSMAFPSFSNWSVVK